MIDSEDIVQIWSPFLDYLVKLELELKCSICTNLLKVPKVLPCDHVFCSGCISSLIDKGSVCPSCDLPFLPKDIRLALHVERLVSIFQEMDDAIGTIVQRKASPPGSPGVRISAKKNPVSVNNHIEAKSIGVQHMPQEKSGHLHSHGSPLTGEGSNKTRHDGENQEIILVGSMNSEQKSGIVVPLDKGSPNCPSTFSENGDSNLDIHDTYSEHTTKKSPTKTIKADSYASHEVRRPQLSPSSVTGHPITKDDGKTAVGSSQTRAGVQKQKTSKRQKLNNKRVKNHTIQHVRTPSIVFGDECAFCHSFRTTEASGPMCCYKDGRLVAMEEAGQSHVTHAHQKCIEWAPQIYFSGDTVKNLEVELRRASKIKCSKCGLKGAALGCYFGSCPKSFHVPCAVEIFDCRWDCVNFHVLCPNHSSEKLPCDDDGRLEKSSGTTHFPSVQIECRKSSGNLTEHQSSEHHAAAVGVKNDRIFIGSALMDSEKELLVKFASLVGGTVTEMWRPDVTHVIASTNESSAYGRTHNVLMAILTGKWVLTTKWVKVCMEAGHFVWEEPYEVRFDMHGFTDGPPMRGRLGAMEKAQKLFAGLSFRLSEHFTLSCRQSLKELVVTAGGVVLEDDILIPQDPFAIGFPALCFIYNEEPPQEYDPRGLAKVKDERCEEAIDFFKKTGARVRGHTRVLDAIAALDIRYLLMESAPKTVGSTICI
ncbi:unnamed protein product [Musa acuminata subsp. malaccensis]|uniref:RING-type E3 ubiquitin transferase BRCA1 n=1 Tax=Musa acuminata subsp. malaccensis TaxID=214687 RepID=A0A804K697_MUSAM|nr:unnamed protein product [Musa acuminata subsp. malaccensis]